jgi:aryl carrier-like protein
MSQTYVPIRRLPILPASGKINRRALQQIASELSTADLSSLDSGQLSLRKTKSPSTKMEKRIQGLWQTLLEEDQIGVDDNFFDLGGGSVLAMRLVSMARREGMTLTVNEVFKSPTLKDLALTVREKTSTDSLVPFSLLIDLDVGELSRQAARQCGIPVEEIEDMYPCAAMQLHYINGYPEAKKTLSDPWEWQSQVVYALPQSLDLVKFKAVWEAAIHRHPVLRTRLVKTSAGVFQTVLKEPNAIQWNEADDIERYEEEDRSDRMTFGRRLLRLAIVESKIEGQRLFVMTVHHTTYDAFARSILFNELETEYFQGFPDVPLPKMNQFISYITGADKSTAVAFWAAHLEDAITKPLLKIPMNGIKTLTQIEKTVIAMDIPKLRGSEWTLPTIIEVAGGLAIAHHVGCPDVIFYSDRSGRNLPVDGIQDLIGPTTLFLPVRVQVDMQQRVHDLLRDSQCFQQDMMPFEHLGWLELRKLESLNPILKNSLNMNINPHRLDSLGKGLGLEFRNSHCTFDDPFGINVDLYEGKMEWVIYYDERFIAEETVDRLGKDMKNVFIQLVEAQPELTVRDVFESL